MAPIERGIIEKAGDNLARSFDELADGLNAVQPLATGDSLSTAGKFLVLGYLIGVLSMVRETNVESNPVTLQDYQELLGVVRQREEDIARGLRP